MMAEAKTEQEPSIEEILESIRQIISEDGDEKPAEALAPATAPKSAPMPQSVLAAAAPLAMSSGADDADIIDLTDRVAPPAPAAPTVLQGVPAMADDKPSDLSLSPAAGDDKLLSDSTADAATAAMAKLLAGNVSVERHEEPARVGKVTLEDIARELMRPLVKNWLDQNLPKVIEKIVAREVEKLARRALDQ